MSLKHRVGKLEEHAGTQRCSNCRDWPEPFIVFEQPGKDPPANVPDYCPDCGYQPLVIIVRFTEDADRL